jgi:hypothetical protein
MSQPFVKVDTALNSLRESDFDCYSAYAEAIDNSIQAKACMIWVDFEEKRLKAGANSVVSEVTFTDNGEGMDVELLHRCLTLGESSRYNDRSGIGRFGVGMTLGAIHEARRIEVYSKIRGGTWRHTYLDLDEIADGTLTSLPFPTEKTPPAPTTSRLNDGSGTVVIWRKCDRARDNYLTVVEESRFYFGRVFRKFIWGTAKGYNAIELFVNNQTVPAFDPLFVTTEKTRFPLDEPGELFPEATLNWKVSNPSEFGQTASTIRLNMSLVHPFLRPKMGAGDSNTAKERYLHRNEGVSIMRNDREVFFGNIPHSKMLPSDSSGEGARNKTRYIGIEIAFDAVLDSEFTVKNIKRGAVPIPELRIELDNLIKPTISTCFQRISELWSSIERQENTAQANLDAEAGISGARSNTNNKIAKGFSRLSPPRGTKSVNRPDVEVAASLSEKPDLTAEEIQRMIQRLKENGIIVEERQWPGSIFMEMKHANSFKTLIYNTNSKFYQSYREIFDKLSQTNNEVANQYQLLIDLIFVSYMLAESDLPAGQHDTTYIQEMFKNFWTNRMSEVLRYVSE